ncbi:MAG: hypothetical protein R6V59_02635 [Dehalococcoidia bacterium]
MNALAILEGHLASVRGLAARFFPQASVELRYRRLTQYALRIDIAEEFFIDVYYNGENQRQSYALIKKGERVFGCDNLLGWHYHPRENPDRHNFCQAAPSLEEIFTQLEQTAGAIRSDG